MNTQELKYRIGKTGYLIKELEERVNNESISNIGYQVNMNRMRDLKLYKNDLQSRLKDLENSTWEHPFGLPRDDGIVSRVKNHVLEYHTSYGWFTNEQIKNLQNSRYFNE